jgi:hypothetical protein
LSSELVQVKSDEEEENDEAERGPIGRLGEPESTRRVRPTGSTTRSGQAVQPTRSRQAVLPRGRAKRFSNAASAGGFKVGFRQEA